MSITIKTHGEYYYKSETVKGRRAFEQVIKAPSLDFFKQTAVRYTGTDDEGKLKFSETEFVNVRGIIKKRLLPLLLAPKFPDFVRVRSVTIDEIIDNDSKAALDLPVTLQSRTQLIELCRTRKIPIDAAGYMDVDELRTDILEYQTDPDVFLKTMERKNKKRQDEKEFMRLNGLMDDPVLPKPTTFGPLVSKPKSPSAGIADL